MITIIKNRGKQMDKVSILKPPALLWNDCQQTADVAEIYCLQYKLANSGLVTAAIWYY